MDALKIPSLIKKLGDKIEKKREHIDELQFDLRYNINTGDYISLEDLEDSQAIVEHGHDYHGTPSKVIKTLCAKLDIHFSDFTFVDYGSGLGRTLFVAHELGFRNIIGLEYSKLLHTLMKQNIEKSNLLADDKQRISTVCTDASTFDLPHSPCVLYLFNPFDAHLMEKFAETVQTSFLSAPRSMYVVYYNPWYRETLDKNAHFRCIYEGQTFSRLMWSRYYPFVIYKLENTSNFPI